MNVESVTEDALWYFKGVIYMLNPEIRSIVRRDDSELRIKWRLTNACNFHCRYCIRDKSLDERQQALDDEQLVLKAIPDVARIINHRATATRLDVIGGEVTLLNLPLIFEQLFSQLKSNYVKSVHITSNMSRPVDYFRQLSEVFKKYDVSLRITFSWHDDYFSLDGYFDKLIKILMLDSIRISAETVATEDKKDVIDAFEQRCLEHNLHYLIDSDIRVAQEKKVPPKAASISHYVIFNDNTTKPTASQKFLLKEYGSIEKNIVECTGMYCTLDYDYLYFEKDQHVGWLSDPSKYKKGKKCKQTEPLSEFNFSPTLHVCENTCSLCGGMSVSTNSDELIEYSKNKKAFIKKIEKNIV